MTREFTLPELGENIESGDVVRVLVSAGDTLREEQPVLELETEKATIEVPAPFPGRVTQVHVRAGEKVKVGQVILTVEEAGETSASPPQPAAQEPAPAKRPPGGEAETSPPRPAQSESGPESRHAEAHPGPPEEEAEEPAARPPRAFPDKVVDFERRASRAADPDSARAPVPAPPSVRRLARELGVEISQVPGSGPGARISMDDVKSYVRALLLRLPASSSGAAGSAMRPEATPLPDFDRWGEVERKPMTAIRRTTARHLSQAWSTIPQVTQFDKADITEIEKQRQRLASLAESGGGKLTLTVLALKVAAAALQLFPQFAASVDMEREEILYKKYTHIGVAVDTERGLLVPVLRDVDRKDIFELARELTLLSEKARNRKLQLEEMSGGTFTITNLGGIGGTAFSPIVNFPEVAILGMARARPEAVLQDGAWVPRLLLPLSLSYDHRVIDGADAARFLRWIAQALEQPTFLALRG